MWELLPLNGIHLIYSKLPYSIIFHSKGDVSAISFFYILYSNIKKAVNLHLYHSCSSEWNIFYIFFVARKWIYFMMKLNLIPANIILRLLTAYFTVSHCSAVFVSPCPCPCPWRWRWTPSYSINLNLNLTEVHSRFSWRPINITL